MKKIVNFFIATILIIQMILIINAYSYDRLDVNHDGNIDIKDMLVIQKYILENSKEDDNK